MDRLAKYRFQRPSKRGAAWCLGLVALLALCVLPARAAADATLFAPVGGRTVRLPDRTLCPDPGANIGWTFDPDGHGVRPPAGEDAVGQSASVAIASDGGTCAAPTAHLTLLAVAPRPVVEPASVVVDIDAGQLVARGRSLRGAQLFWSAAGRNGSDACSEPQTSGGVETCTFAIARGLPADSTQLDVAFLGAGARVGPDVVGYDAQGRRLNREDYTLHPARVLIGSLFSPDAAIDMQAGAARLHLLHGEAIAAVECTDAACDIDANDLVIRGEHGSNDALEIHAHFRPHTFVQRAGALDANPIAVVPLQRCPVAIVSPPPLRGIGEQNVIVRLGGGCARDASLQFVTSNGVASALDSRVLDDRRYAVVHLDRADTDEVRITVQRGMNIVGTARIATRRPPATHARLEIADLGAIDFIPTNRDATVLAPTGLDGASLVPLAVEGVYDVSRTPGGAYTIRGAAGAAGTVALRLAYRSRDVPTELRDLDLAVVTEPVDRAIHPASIPIPLGTSAPGTSPLIELLCGNGSGRVQRVATGTTLSIPFRGRDTCRIAMHGERVRIEDGSQAIHLSIDIVASDGTPRTEAHVDRRIVLRRATEPRYLYVTGVQSPFDRVIVRASLAGDDSSWAIPLDEPAVGAQAQWTVINGTDRFRLYATAAIPTGLFRVSDVHSGIMALNAGAVVRLVWLTREGHESPIGLESGVLWASIVGDTAVRGGSALGEVAVVSGVGIGVPIANQSRTTQASINLHAWVEYEVSRQFVAGAGIPWGFVFGPSISIGDVGTNF